MQLFAAIGLALSVIYLGWLRPRYMKIKAPKKLMIFLLVALAVIGGSEARWEYLQWRGSEAIKVASGNPNGSLDCQRFLPSLFDTDSASLGGKVTTEDVNVAHLKNGQCNELFSWIQAGSPSNPSEAQTIAIHVITHESIHTTGQFSEAIAECTAVQRDPLTVKSLGGDDKTGLFVQSTYFKNTFPRLSDAYHLPGCKIDPSFDSITHPAAPAKQ